MTKEAVKTDKTVYEVGYHIVPAVSPENLTKEVEAIKSIIGAHGTEIISEEFPKEMNLAYTMVKSIGQVKTKYDRAYFGWIKFYCNSDEIESIKKQLDEMNSILRFIIVKTVAENTIYGPKVLPKEEKESEEDESKDDSSEENTEETTETEKVSVEEEK